MHSSRQERRNRGEVVAVEDRPGERRRPPHLDVDNFDLHGRLVDQDADGQGQLAERHDVDRVIRHPQAAERAQEPPSGMLNTTTIAMAPVAQEQEDHQAGRRRLRSAPPAPTFSTAVTTVGDSSNAKLMSTSSGRTPLKTGIAFLMSDTTGSVEAVLFLMIGRQIDLRPSFRE